MKALACVPLIGLLMAIMFPQQSFVAENMRYKDRAPLVMDAMGVPEARIVSQAQSDGDAFMMQDFDAEERCPAQIRIKKCQRSLRAGPDARRQAILPCGCS